MKTSSRTIATNAIFALLLTVLCSGCEREGPAEQAGKQIDEAAQQAGQQLEQAAETAGEKMEEAGAEMQQAVEGTQQ